VGLFSHDSELVIFGELRGQPQIWHVASKTLVHALPHGEDDFFSVCMNLSSNSKD
jgi:hypothetical protein